MNAILSFIKDWVPSLAVIVAGLWLLFQWLFGEWLRRQKEMPALEGKLATKVIPLADGQHLVTVEAVWHNRSPLPLPLDINQCRIDVFRISQPLNKSNCALTLKTDLGEPVCSHVFLKGMCEVDYFFEPNTESTIINYFVLEPGIYGIRMVLHSLAVGGQWWKEAILNTQESQSVDKTS